MPDEEAYWSNLQANANRKLAIDLSHAFEEVAKLCLRAASEFKDDADTAIIPKLEKAHSTVTLAIDDLMRGLNQATMALVLSAMAQTQMSKDAEDEK